MVYWLSVVVFETKFIITAANSEKTNHEYKRTTITINQITITNNNLAKRFHEHHKNKQFSE